MNRYRHNKSNERFREPSVVETIKVAIKRKSMDRSLGSHQHRSNPTVVVDADEIHDLIPSFKGNSSKLKARDWIETVEDIREIYAWDDRLTLVYATLRLQDEAKRWHKESMCQSWQEFKRQFVRRFSNNETESKEDLLEQLVRRKKEDDESYENYVFSIERMALKCEISVEATINYIILGIRDHTLRNKLINSDCLSVDELLSLIKMYTIKENNDDLRHQLGRRNHSQEKAEPPKRICFKCREPGHLANACPSTEVFIKQEDMPKRKRKFFCITCKYYGHSFENCFFNTKFCEHCQNAGHTTEECRFKDVCPECKNPGHGRADCPETEVVCYYCYEKGHWAQVCEARKKAFEKFRDDGEERRSVSRTRSERSPHSIRGSTHDRRQENNFIDRRNDLEMVRKREPVVCRICDRPGHSTKECNRIADALLIKPHDKKMNRALFCRKCKRTGHYTRDCETRPPSPIVEKTIIVFCRNCKVEGHSTRECTFRQDSSRSPSLDDRRQRGYCRRCKMDGHSTRDCNVDDSKHHLHHAGKIERESRSPRPRHHSVRDDRESRSPRPRHHSVRDDRSSSLDFERGRRINLSTHENYCGTCKTYGHNANNCRVVQQQQVIIKPSGSDHNHALFCRICRTSGHYTKDCKFENSNEDRRPQESKIVGYCRNCKIEGHSTRECKVSETRSSEVIRAQRRSRSRSRERDIYCKICKKDGHSTRECKFTQFEREGFCRTCRRSGHSTRDCKERILRNEESSQSNRIMEHSPAAKRPRLAVKPIGVLVEQKYSQSLAFENQARAVERSAKETLTSSIRSNRNLSELLKPVRIENVYVTALVNLGSDCTTLQKSEFERHDWKMEPCSLEINGFASTSSRTLGKITKNVGIGEVSLVIDIFIVEDDIQDFPLVLGSNFLDHPSICVIKKYRSLEIKWVKGENQTVAPVATGTHTMAPPAVTTETMALLPPSIPASVTNTMFTQHNAMFTQHNAMFTQHNAMFTQHNAMITQGTQPSVAETSAIKREPFGEVEEDNLLRLLNSMDQEIETHSSQFNRGSN